ncbi:hypothetical protein FA15DRAFT_487676 [Coprinopsis marcescibilis]|uniref:PEBP-like protein n=1 Tax=Coprinopsis marcescibilis TaxID=230819 RepID=A0A5C3L803_COPMA|nr:hypothetical protein FA15DRAFT_487676 [Coprinopsis marcescibilis]
MRYLHGFALTLFFSVTTLAQDSEFDPAALNEVAGSFTSAGIVPELIPEFQPSALVTPIFNHQGETIAINPGDVLTLEEATNQPTYSLSTANDTLAAANGTFVLALLGPSSKDTNGTLPTLHFLRGNFTLDEEEGTLTSQVEALAGFEPPSHEDGTDYRYVLLVFNQPEGFDTAAPALVNSTREDFNLTRFSRGVDLDAPIAGSYFLVDATQHYSAITFASTRPSITGNVPTFTPLLGSGQRRNEAVWGPFIGLCITASLMLLVH